MESVDYAPRFSWDQLQQLVPDVIVSLGAIGAAIDKSGLDVALIELLKIRASQINGCAFCVQFHINKARRSGVDSVKLDMLAVWRDVGIFSARERAALAWAEALTNMPRYRVADDVYEWVKQHFNEKEVASLTAAISLINAWNRMMGALRVLPPPPLK